MSFENADHQLEKSKLVLYCFFLQMSDVLVSLASIAQGVRATVVAFYILRIYECPVVSNKLHVIFTMKATN